MHDELKVSYEIAYGDNKHSTQWDSSLVNWEDIVATFEESSEYGNVKNITVAEYQALPKTAKGDIKDGACFVAGKIRGRREKHNVKSRSMIVLDADYVYENTGAFLFKVAEVLKGVNYIMYSTFSHTPENGKLRVIIPLNRDLHTALEYNAVSRHMAAQIGINYFDKTCHEWNRLMYLPASCKDAVTVFESETNGKPIDVDSILDQYSDIADANQLPMHEGEKTEELNRSLSGKKMAEPTDKKGIVGIFCRSYTVSEALDTFLVPKGLYEPTGNPDRYTWLGGSQSAAGLRIYDNDTFATASNDSDPTYGQSVNAFDLVRLVLFGELDKGVSEKVNVTKRPSFQAMSKLISEDKLCRKEMIDTQIGEEFADMEEDEQTGVDKPKWTDKLQFRDGKLDLNGHNLDILITHGQMEGVLGYDEMLQTQCLMITPPWGEELNRIVYHQPLPLEDEDLNALFVWLNKKYGFESMPNIQRYVDNACARNKFHPIKRRIESKPWDGVKRAENYFIKAVGAPDNDTTRQVTRKWLLAVLSGIYRSVLPYKYRFEQVLVLACEEQGSGKSTSLEKLCFNVDEWFVADVNELNSKETAELIGGGMIAEFGEMEVLQKNTDAAFKRFMSKQADKYRPAYAKKTITVPRRCAFAGTTNHIEFLRDSTGNRRYWVLECVKLPEEQGHHNTIPTNAPSDSGHYYIQQLWAEVLTWLAPSMKGAKPEPLTLSGEAKKEMEKIQDRCTMMDDRAGMVWTFLETPTSDDINKEPERPNEVSVRSIAVECFGESEKGALDKHLAKVIRDAMKKATLWKKESSPRNTKYGSQRVWTRINKD